MSPDGRTVYVALSGSPKCRPPSMPDAECEKLKADKTKDGIAEVDVVARRVRRVLPGGSDPEQFDISSDGKRLYISNEDAGTASVVNVKSGTIDTTVPVGAEPEGVRLSPDGKLVYVTAESDTSIRVLDAATGAVKARIKVGRRPRDVAFTPDGKRAYATAEVGGTVSVIDVASNRVIATIKAAPDAKPMGVRVSPDGESGVRGHRPGRNRPGDRPRHQQDRARSKWGNGPGASPSPRTGRSSMPPTDPRTT